MNGAFTIDIRNGTGSAYNHLNAFVITEIDGSGGNQLLVTNAGARIADAGNKKPVVVRILPNHSRPLVYLFR